ncbi:MAG: DUF3754 domain-containing protein [Pirellulaceae bacterium]
MEQPNGRRENFVPLHTCDVIEWLVAQPTTGAEAEKSFTQIASLIVALLHHLYRQRHEQLTYVYAPLDPDRDRLLRSVPTDGFRKQLIDELLERTEDTLHRANYHKLSAGDINEAMEAASRWGVRMRVNFAMLRKLEVYGRGHVVGQRQIRNWQRFFRLETVEVPLYQRLIVIFQTSPDLKSDQFDSRRVYLRMFKNIPRQDIDMMLPATGIQMTWLDHSKIVVPSLYAAGMALWRFLRNVVLLAFFGVFKTLGFFVLVVLAVGFGVRSMFAYRTNTKRRYMLNMAQNLYYQNLDNNAGVLLRLLEEGEQQEAIEAILAYYATAIALRDRGPLSLEAIDLECERLLKEATNIEIDFDVERTVRTLAQLGVLEANQDGWSALPPDKARKSLDATWESWFS